VLGELADGGEITMPFSVTFWSPGFGACTDRFGVPWMVDTEPAPEG
jgi:PhnB protein